MADRIEKYTETVRKHDEWLGADEKLKPGDFLTFLDENGEPWNCGFVCPCGCGRECWLRLCQAGRPHHDRIWEYKAGGNLVNPSVHWTSGCCAHFYIKADGSVQWC